VYGLHPLLPTKYLLPSKLDENKDPQPIRVLINRLFKLEKTTREHVDCVGSSYFQPMEQIIMVTKLAH
jgi:hypothetical protein